MNFFVKVYDTNARKIIDWDVFRHIEADVRKLKKTCATKEEFAERVRSRMLWQFWSRCEYEVILSRKNGRIILSPWAGSRNPEAESIDVTDEGNYDWVAFASYTLGNETDDGVEKIDVYDQFMFKMDEYIDKWWHTRFKYERDNPKFH